MVAPPKPYIGVPAPTAHTTVPRLVSAPPPLPTPLLYPSRMTLEIFRVAPDATVSAPLRSPPSQVMVPPTVSGELPLRPPLNVTLLTVTGAVTVIATPKVAVAVSAGPGTW